MRFRRGVVVAVLGIGILATSACGSSTSPTSNATPPEDCRGLAETQPGAPPPGLGVSYAELTVDGKLRDYRLFEPPAVTTTKPVALVLEIPPPSADANLLESLIHFDREAQAGGFLAASLNGCGTDWSYEAGSANAADEHFVRRVIDQLESKFTISAVFAISVSGGSRMLYRLACDLSNQITAVADVAGTMILKDPCSPSRPVSVLEIHGTADADSPWAGGGPHGSYPVEDVNQRWRTIDGCAGNPVVTHSGITITSTWRQCTGGAVVTLEKVVGGQHTWFGVGDSDAVPGEPNASAAIWSFFTSLSSTP